MLNITKSYYLEVNTPNIILSTIAAALSLFGTAFIVITFFIWKEIQSTSRRILVYISIADFFVAVGGIVGVLFSKYKIVCLVQSIAGTFSVLCSFFWTVFLAVYLFVGCTRKNILMAERLMCLFHIIGWGVPFTIVCIAATTSKLGDNGDVVSSGWCWVSATLSWDEQVEWMLIAGKFWEVTAFIIITILYICIRRGMRKVVSRKKLFTTQYSLFFKFLRHKLALYVWSVCLSVCLSVRSVCLSVCLDAKNCLHLSLCV
jgi:G protein-coupled receptor 157